jgi:hypothetical protein
MSLKSPRTDFFMPDVDNSIDESYDVMDLASGCASSQVRVYLAWVDLASLPPGHVDDESWEDRYDQSSIYPPIKIHWNRNGVDIIDGNHRRIMFEKWGFLQVAAWVFQEPDALFGALKLHEVGNSLTAAPGGESAQKEGKYGFETTRAITLGRDTGNTVSGNCSKTEVVGSANH